MDIKCTTIEKLFKSIVVCSDTKYVDTQITWWCDVTTTFTSSFLLCVDYNLHTTRCPMSTSVHMFDFFVLLILLSCGIFCIFLHTVGINFFHSFFISFSSHSRGVLINCLPPNKVSRSPQSRPHPPRLYDVWVLDLPQRKITANRLFIPSIYLLKSQYRDKKMLLSKSKVPDWIKSTLA